MGKVCHDFDAAVLISMGEEGGVLIYTEQHGAYDTWGRHETGWRKVFEYLGCSGIGVSTTLYIRHKSV